MSKKTIDDRTVMGIAKLSRLGLRDDEVRLFAAQMSDILGYIEKLNEVKTSDVEPTSHALSGLVNVFREDEEKASIPAEDALKNAPKRIGDLFAVPKIIE